MDARSIQDLCIAGSEAYLAYLKKNEKGLERTRVLHKEILPLQPKPTYMLVLARRLFRLEAVSLELLGVLFGPNTFEVIEYDGDAKSLIVEVKSPELDLETTPTDALFVVSDLRFLVENVKSWLYSNGSRVSLPAGSRTCEDCEDCGELNGCQQDSVREALGNSLTYVWGPPGTGKTRHVLTRGAMRIVLAGGTVGIFAPTNNALEQAMEPLIKAAASAGIKQDECLRVGIPSANFARDFAKACEHQGVAARREDLREQIEIYKRVLDHRRDATVVGSAAMLQHGIGELQELLQERTRYYEELGEARRKLLSRIFGVTKGRIRELDDRIASLERTINGRIEMVMRTRTEVPEVKAVLQRLNLMNVDSVASELHDLERATRQSLEQTDALARGHKSSSDEDIQAEIDRCEGGLARLQAQIHDRIKEAKVIGMTLDCFVGRFSDTLLPLTHIFLDEAGYAPLVKALTLCREGVPLTFVGDHKQLGPVCEMDDRNLATPEGRAAVVWSKSALFLDELFLAKDAEDAISRLFELSEPRLTSFTRSYLDETFRFGQNLADILSKCVYDGLEFISNVDQPLEVNCIPAVPHSSPARRRENLAEVEAIVSFLKQNPDLGDGKENAYAILAPYKNQVSLIGKAIPEARREGRIMTVHKAQGREWNTVILSIVDGIFNRPWFTDTTNPESGGLYVMNTAISRARKRLVLICDQGFWSGQDPGQLIPRILS